MEYKAEFGDIVQFLLSKYNDHQIHSALYFQKHIDVECLNKAIITSIELIPILNSRFVLRKKPHWEVIESINASIVSENTCKKAELDNTIKSFFANRINIFQGPQILITVIHCEKQDILCIILNHMISDAGGFKEYLYLIASIYSQIKCDGYFIPGDFNLTRSLKEITSRFPIFQKLRIHFNYNTPNRNLNKADKNVHCNFIVGNNRFPLIIKYKISADTFQTIKEYSKKQKVTINDIIMAAYIRTIYKFINITEGSSITVPCPVNIRNYLTEDKKFTFCNLSPVIMCNIGTNIGQDFYETVKKVNQLMDSEKSKLPYSKLATSMKLQFIIEHFPLKLFQSMFVKVYTNPMFVMTNIGIIKDEKLKFGALEIEDAFITGSIKEPPALQMSVSTFKNNMSFSINLYGSNDDEKIIKSFLDLFVGELSLL